MDIEYVTVFKLSDLIDATHIPVVVPHVFVLSFPRSFFKGCGVRHYETSYVLRMLYT